MPLRGIRRKASACGAEMRGQFGSVRDRQSTRQRRALPLREGETRQLQVEARSFRQDVGLLLQAGCSYEMRARGCCKDAHDEWGPEGHAGVTGVYRRTVG